MEPAREPPWAEHEKVYLLAEILKASLPSHVLLNIIRESHVSPKWNDIALPHGRSINSCHAALNDMHATIPPSDYRQQRPQLPPPPMAYPSSDIPKKRAHQPENTAPIGRLLQPRPPHPFPGQDYGSGPTYPIPSANEPANKKKRGRPTKAEAQARADAAAARGEVYPPPRKSRPSVTTSDPASGEPRQQGESPPASVAMQPTVVMTPQQTQPPDRSSESSSGKKKRNKPTPLELEKPQREPTGTESPLAYGSAAGDPNRSHPYSTFTPISAPLPSDIRDRDVRMEGVEESQPRTTTPRSFKDTVGI